MEIYSSNEGGHAIHCSCQCLQLSPLQPEHHQKDHVMFLEPQPWVLCMNKDAEKINEVTSSSLCLSIWLAAIIVLIKKWWRVET